MTPLERIELSRARLRRALLPPNRNGPARPSWLVGVKDLPFIGAAIGLLREWRSVGQVVVQVSRAAVTPLAERNPLALVLAAGAAGAILMWGRPWRRKFSSAVLAGLVPRLVARAVLEVPIESWAKMLGAALSGTPRRDSNPRGRS
jgi:hypothetical protein